MKHLPILPVLFAILFASCVTAPPPSPPTKARPVQKAMIVKAANPPPRAAPTTLVTRTLTWVPNPPSDDVVGYKIYEVIRKTDTTPAHWAEIGMATTTGFTLNGLVVGSFHVYYVTAINSNGESLSSIPLIYRVN